MAAEDAEEEVPAEETDGDGDESSDGNSKAGGKKKLILFVALPVIVLLAGGAGAYFLGFLDPLIGEPPAEETLENEERENKPQAIFYDLPEMLVNLNSSGRKTNYLKLSISLELDDAAEIDFIEQVLPRIIDNFQVYLRELRVEDLRGSAGLTRLREELLMRINIAARPAKVSDVLFREMLIQ